MSTNVIEWTIIAGGRNFSDYEHLSDILTRYTNYINKPIGIVSGNAIGADSLGERYAHEHDIPIRTFPAEWSKYGKSAGYRRNEEMAKHATTVIAFWDGASLGTKHMITYARSQGLTVYVIRY